MTPAERAYLQTAMKNIPPSWREELLEMWTWVKPETKELLENGPKSLAQSWIIMSLKKKYLELKGIIPNPDEEWKVEATRREALQKKEDEEFDSITDEEWTEFFMEEARARTERKKREEANRKKPIWPKWFYYWRGRFKSWRACQQK